MKSDTIHVRLSPGVHERLKAAAAGHERSVAWWAARLIEEGLDQPTEPLEATTGHNSATSVKTPPQRLVEAVIAYIDVEVRREQDRPLGPILTHAMKALLDKPDLAHVTDLRTARAAGVDTWVNQGARPGLIAVLFPDDATATHKARQGQNRTQMDKRRAVAPAATQVAVRFGIVGRGSTVFNRLLRESFAGMTVERAVEQGPEAWLDAGVTEAVARKLFDEATAKEARRRADARGNAKRRHGQATATNTTGVR